MSRNAPVFDEPLAEEQVQDVPSRRVGRRQRQQKWDQITVMVLTPTLLISTVVGVFTLGALFYPDPDPPQYFAPTPTSVATASARAVPTQVIVVQPVDTAKLNAGIVEKPPPFDWPDVEDLKVVPNPGRPSEQADYTPNIADVEKRKVISASTVSMILHTNAAFAQAAAEELAKSYPVRPGKHRVIDIEGMGGYLPDESAYAVVFNHTGFRIHVETVGGSPPFTAAQRAEVEYHTLHLADHILRRVQELASGGKRTGPEATAVHWRDHLVRQLPFGR